MQMRWLTDVMTDSTPHIGFPVDAQSLKWDVLPQALDWGKEAEVMYQKTKKDSGLPSRNARLRKRRADTRLRVTDPW